MKNLLALAATAALTFAAVGWYLEWYKVSSTPASEGHRNVSIDLNSTKISADVHKGIQKGESKIQNVLDKGSEKPATVTQEVEKVEAKTKALTDEVGKAQQGLKAVARDVDGAQEKSKTLFDQWVIPASSK